MLIANFCFTDFFFTHEKQLKTFDQQMKKYDDKSKEVFCRQMFLGGNEA
jgi:hypothetical protein